MSPPLVIGVDSSTQSTKLSVHELDGGSRVGLAVCAHPTTSPPVSEQDPRAWFEALVSALGSLRIELEDVVAISIAGQQHGLVLLDDDGEPVRPAKLWNDTTSAPQAQRLVETLGARSWAEACGSVPVASFSITKLAWMADHEAGLLSRTAQVMLPHDYLTWRLTGEAVTDRGDASGTGWFDPAQGTYREDLLEIALGSARTFKLPSVLGPSQRAGYVDAAVAAEVGLGAGVVVGVGTGDNMGAALGLCLEPGDTALSLGTSGTVYSVSQTPSADSTGAVAGFADATGNFLPLVCTLNATKVTDTVASWLGTDAPGLASLALEADQTGTRPVLLPYFDGERTPNLPDSVGVFTGLRTSTTPGQLALAAHDGVLCGLLDGLDALDAAGIETTGPIHLVGGGARSAVYPQRCADLSGRSIIVHDDEETVAVGAAIQAAAAYGSEEPLSIGRRWSLGSTRTVNPSGHPHDDEVRAAYMTLRDTMHP
ncbi:MAG: xylulokinase [Acidobacteria bacterium]|nr:xylulokinase [Acidobacteriota bacterium]